MYMQFQSIYVAPHWKVQEQRGKEFSTQICQKKKDNIKINNKKKK